MRNRIVIGAAAAAVVFLLGFVPQFVKARRLEGELRQARQENAVAGLRDLAALAFIQASQKNYGLAAATSVHLFRRAQETAAQSEEPGRKKALEAVLARRDGVTAQLAKGIPPPPGLCRRSTWPCARSRRALRASRSPRLSSAAPAPFR